VIKLEEVLKKLGTFLFFAIKIDRLQIIEYNRRSYMNLENQITSVEQLPLSLTVSDISHSLRISLKNAYELCHSEVFPSVAIGNRIIIPRPAFEAWLSNPNKFKGNRSV
jgi:hypothetical protein